MSPDAEISCRNIGDANCREGISLMRRCFGYKTIMRCKSGFRRYLVYEALNGFRWKYRMELFGIDKV